MQNSNLDRSRTLDVTGTDRPPHDPLFVRALVEQTRETARWAEELWVVFLDDLAPHDDDVEPWPPALDDGGYYDELRPRYEERLRAGV